MISYEPFWQTMKDKGISQYNLIHNYSISASLLDRLRKNANLNTYTLNRLCNILDCEIEDICKFYRD